MEESDDSDYNFYEKIIMFLAKCYYSVAIVFLKFPMYIWEIYDDYRAWYFFKFTSKAQREKKHAEGAKRVQNQILKWISEGRKNKMCTARPGWMTLGRRSANYKNKLTNIEVNLKDIVSLDKEKLILKVEPMVTMGVIYSVLLPTGYTLQVCPEMNELTIGGLCMSSGGETSSHKYGIFNNVVESYELVLPNGEIKTCSRTKDHDLFWGLQNSHGTIGFIVGIELRLVPCHKYVYLKYQPSYSLDDYLALYKREIDNPDNFFVECLTYSLEKAVIITGKMVPNANGPINRINRWYKQLWYKYTETFLEKGVHSEYMTLSDYYQRHRRGAFWGIEIFFGFADNPLFLYLLGWCLPVKISLFKLLLPKFVLRLFDKKMLLEDYCIPFSKLKEILILTDKEILFYPLWLCPFLSPKKYFPEDLKRGVDEVYTDVGIYGCSKLKRFDAIKAIRKLEKFTLKTEGAVATYVDIYMSKEEYSEMFMKNVFYEKVRKKYDCERAFPDVYDKICRAGRGD